MRLAYLSEAQERWVRAWWNALQPADGVRAAGPPELQRLDRGDRARLRRVASIEELETERAAQLLAKGLSGMSWKKLGIQHWVDENAVPLLMTAGVLAAVKEDARDGRSLAWRAGQAATKGGPSQMSELRFKRLLKARGQEEFFTAARRAVAQCGGRADVAVLADDLLAWDFEQHLRGVERPPQTMAFRWAQDYYQPTKGGDARQAADEKTAEGERA
jgi:CRISPR system Cascade subunit CasB